MSINTVTVRTKLTVAFGVLALLIAVVAGLAVKALGDAEGRFSNFVQGINARLLLSYEVRTAVQTRAILARDTVNAATQEDKDAAKAAVLKVQEDISARMALLTKMAAEPGVSDEARALIGKMAEIEAKYAPVVIDIVGLAAKGQRDWAVAKINAECRPTLASLIKAADEYRNYTSAHSDDLLARAAADYASQRNMLFAGCMLAFIAALAAGAWIIRSLSTALGAEPAILSEVVARVASGDLSQPLAVKDGDTVSVMASVSLMQEKLSGVVANVRSNSESVATASAQIANGNQDLSQRTEEQASALEETAATMDQLNTTVRNNAENAKQADLLAQGAAAVAVQGGAVVSQVVSTMRGISESSREIGDITGVIDGIAFQTNILALNAAVEAARAGEQGRGFAVVASEVRALAQRSAEAAKQIKSLIGRSVVQVEEGALLVDQAGKTMGEIVGSIKRVSDIVSEISSSSQEQGAGISQVGEAVGQIDRVTQQNAALVEEGAAAAESLKMQAQQLVQAVAVFNLSGNSIGTSSLPSMPAAASPRPEIRGEAEMMKSPRSAPQRLAAVTVKSAPRASHSVPAAASPSADDWASF